MGKIDKRIVYGATCTWWDSINKVHSTPGFGIPCCPHCHGMLYEYPNEETWWKDVEKFEKEGRKHYKRFMGFLRGQQCFPLANFMNMYADFKENING